MAKETDPTATREVALRNSANGDRYVHSTSGPFMVRKGTTSPALTMREGELADLPDGLEILDPDQAEEPDQGGAETGGPKIPADLADPDSRDGMVKADKLREVAEAEGVQDAKADDSKAELVAKIVAHRASTGG